MRFFLCLSLSCLCAAAFALHTACAQTAAPTPPAVPPGPGASAPLPDTGFQPNVSTTLPASVPAGSARAAVGSVQSSNTTAPFTVEALELKRGEKGGRAVLHLALTNNGNVALDASGQFTAGLTDLADPLQISGVYLVDPKTQQRFTVARESQTKAFCSQVSPALNPGERRALDAQFADLPAGVTSVYVYFPHAAPISNVPVTP